MIIKSLTRSTPSFGGLIKYVTRDKGKIQDPKKESFLLTQHLKGEGLIEWEQEFLENETYRKFPLRDDSVMMYHDIISFSEADKDKLTLAMLEDMTREYISERFPGSMCLAVCHVKSNMHVHVMASGVEYRTGLSSRVSKAEFGRIKRAMQDYQIEHYPELEHSIVNHGKTEGPKLTDKEFQIKLRTGKEVAKERISRQFQECFTAARSEQHLSELLLAHNIETYTYRGKLNGVKCDGKKYRFKTIGFEKSRLNELEERQLRKNKLEKLREEKPEMHREETRQPSTSERLARLNQERNADREVTPSPPAPQPEPSTPSPSSTPTTQMPSQTPSVTPGQNTSQPDVGQNTAPSIEQER